MPENNLKELTQKLEKDSKVLRHMLVIKPAQRERKERRTRKPTLAFTQEPAPVINKTEEPAFAFSTPSATESSGVAKEEKVKEKVELSDIEKKLDEILGE
jgi:hypothetical protein